MNEFRLTYVVIWSVN